MIVIEFWFCCLKFIKFIYYEKGGNKVILEFYWDFWYGNLECYLVDMYNFVCGFIKGWILLRNYG